ncbi:hypothetical protein H1W37_17970 [Stappia taiwanensis]|uniref:5'-nucleotidase n=1 Tax=Stappia taiwanensis TaxID=992267 RepID=A0A838XQM8_9HYPH|nr:5'/3'-nucleotidase SurE [Stappia taiwanensis]MBA4613549.1 hypothetical protein [Stappia taiwanensis]GGE96661.1 hypothetical protein GCM10007285_25360 [Stappia taiwanensis]
MTEPGITAAPIAVTCDDGFGAAGFAALIGALRKGGWPLRAGATTRSWPSNGTATGFAAPEDLDAAPFDLAEVAGVRCQVHDAAPAFVARCLLAGASEDAPAPRLLIAGVNAGPNVGRDLIHSGTFGAALTAMWLGLPAIAVSLDDVHSVDERNPGPLRYDLAARVAALALGSLLDAPAPLLVNANIPNSISSDGARFQAATPHPGDGSGLDGDVDALRRGLVAVSVFRGRNLCCDARASRDLAATLARSW